ncbi:hypothetical protein WBJ53_11685 [Spirosoma sp. SC4-14]|uniref:hypothetical protein n=1 Tax=Spirosoma sp. SC4-14 TaxID=3128900 RepID=UPI0030CDA465
MKNLSILLLIFLVNWLYSCQTPLKDQLCQAWQLDGFDVSPDYEQTLAQESSETQRKRFRSFMRTYMKEMVIRFYPNGDYTQLSNNRYTTGRWSFDEASSLLTITENEGKLRFRVEPNNATSLKLFISNSKDVGHEQMSFSLKQDTEYQHDAIDLLARERNKWRQKPTHPESATELKNRLIDQLAYIIDYFELTLKKKQGYFNTSYLDAPFRFYQNGVGLYNESELPTNWKNCYFNEADALKAHAMLISAFKSGLVYPAKTETFTEGYAKFLRQVKVYLIAENNETTDTSQ